MLYFRYGKENSDGRYNSLGSYCDDKYETIRKTAVSILGHDVNVSWGLEKDASFVCLSIILSLIGGLFVTYFIDKKIEPLSEGAGVALFLVVSIISFLIIIFIS